MTNAERIERELLTWPGVTADTHRFGGREFRVGRRELGHLHGSQIADLPFPARIRETLVAEGRAVAHHALPQTGWVTVYLREAGDVDRALALFRLNYERPWLGSESAALHDAIDEESEDSFPASDAPSHTPVTGAKAGTSR